MQKNILFYKENEEILKNGFLNYPGKEKTYRFFFQSLCKKNCPVFLVNKGNYLGSFLFSQAFQFNESVFSRIEAPIHGDLLFDRGPLKSLPAELSPIAFNAEEFKFFCGDKWATQKMLGNSMPASHEILSTKTLRETLSHKNPSEIYVLKPKNGLKGKGIFIASAQSLLQQMTIIKEPYLLQEFIDTSAGIPGIVDGIHDIRVIVIGGEVIMASLRTPATGNMLANVAQGGTIREISYKHLSKSVRQSVAAVQEKIDQRYNLPFYSIDFGVRDDRIFVFELNDRVGFPNDSMPSAPIFAKKLADRLLKEL